MSFSVSGLRFDRCVPAPRQVQIDEGVHDYMVDSCFTNFHWISGMHDLKNARLKRGLATLTTDME